MNVAKVIDLNPFGPQGERPQCASISLQDAAQKFQDAIASAGLGRPEIEADGRIHRFDLPDEARGKKSGWYLLFPDENPCPAGEFGNWKDESSEKWHAFIDRKYEISKADMDLVTERLRCARAARDEERRKEADLAASGATEILAASPVATDDHPYLQKKQVKAFGLRLGDRGVLLVPMLDKHANTRGLQRIMPDGKKLFHKGVDPRGLFHFIDGDRSSMYICEGYATGASIHMATGQGVIVAFNCGNLEHVATAAKEIFPQAKIVLAADDDKWTKKQDGSPYNPGIEHAKAVGARLGMQVVSPSFRDLSSRPTDFNDLHVLEGIDELKRQLQPMNFAIITLADVMKMEFEERPVIDGLLDEKENLLVIGPSNIGKSLFTINIAAMVAAPQAFAGRIDLNGPLKLFGKFAIRDPRRVLFLQSENTAKSTKKRLSMIIKDRPEFEKSLSNIAIPELAAGDCRVHGAINKDYFDTAVTMIRRSGARVVIIDPLVSFHDADENDNVAMRAALDRFNDLAQVTGTSIVIVHHTGKDATKGARGASAIRDWYDNALILTPAFSSEERFVLRVTHDKSRNYEIQQPFFLERTKNLDYIPVDDPEVYLVSQAIEEAGGLVTSEAALIGAVEILSPAEMSRSHWQNVIKRAIRSGIVERSGSGKNITFETKKQAPF